MIRITPLARALRGLQALAAASLMTTLIGCGAPESESEQAATIEQGLIQSYNQNLGVQLGWLYAGLAPANAIAMTTCTGPSFKSIFVLDSAGGIWATALNPALGAFTRQGTLVGGSSIACVQTIPRGGTRIVNRLFAKRVSGSTHQIVFADDGASNWQVFSNAGNIHRISNDGVSRVLALTTDLKVHRLKGSDFSGWELLGDALAGTGAIAWKWRPDNLMVGPRGIVRRWFSVINGVVHFSSDIGSNDTTPANAPLTIRHPIHGGRLVRDISHPSGVDDTTLWVLTTGGELFRGVVVENPNNGACRNRLDDDGDGRWDDAWEAAKTGHTSHDPDCYPSQFCRFRAAGTYCLYRDGGVPSGSIWYGHTLVTCDGGIASTYERNPDTVTGPDVLLNCLLRDPGKDFLSAIR